MVDDMIKVTEPKSDQQNFDDFLGGRTLTIKITKAVVKAGEQPVSLYFENDGGKPYKPGKSMCRVLREIWGPDSSKYVGKSLTLYGDPEVSFGGIKVGGIRISHMSDMPEANTMALTVSRGKRKPFVVKPLKDMPNTQQPTSESPKELTENQKLAKRIKLAIDTSDSSDSLRDLWNEDYAADLDRLKSEQPKLFAALETEYNAKMAKFSNDDLL